MFPATPGTTPLANIFGVRHLSPAAGHHLAHVLDTLKPTAVLVEGPSDTTELLPHLLHKETRPPVAVLAYTKTRPVRTIIYPLANYSPEWVALTWGLRHKADTRFIDLPAAVFLELHTLHKEEEPEAEEGDDEPEEKPAAEPPANPAAPKISEHTRAYLDDPYEAIANLSGDPDHETWWERHFEHTVDPAAYVGQSFALGKGLRELRDMQPQDENLIREAYMRRCIREVLAKGHQPEKVLVVCGAFHAPALIHELEPMDDKTLKALPRIDTSLTLMPYSYFRLSAQSGYGAGCHAPAYFQRLFEERTAERPERLSLRVLAELAHVMRRAGQIRSAAEVIEAVRLAHSLAALSDSPAPCLRDLRHAAVTCLGRGEEEQIRPHMIEVEIGPAIGRLPKGVGRTAIQDDFHMQAESLLLDKYLTEKVQELTLDLREDRRAKSAEAAFRDRNRSTFLHRLSILGIEFAKLGKTGQAASLPDEEDSSSQKGTSREVWQLKWSPECEIQLVEAAFQGDTIDMAASSVLAEKLNACTKVDEAALIVRQAFVCELGDALEEARRRVQAMAVEDTSFVALARAVNSLSEVVAYGSVRKFDPEPLGPLLAQLFLRATLFAEQACLCDRQAAKDVHQAMVLLNRVAQERHDLVNADRWFRELDTIAAADHLNPFLSGFAGGVSLEMGRLGEQELAALVSRRLSPGLEAERGAGWFEGLSQHNRQALFSRLLLWEKLDEYVQSLNEDEFKRALVYLRRAFSEFAPGEVRRVVSLLVEISPEKAEELKASTDVKLSEAEAQQLQEQLGDLELL